MATLNPQTHAVSAHWTPGPKPVSPLHLPLLGTGHRHPVQSSWPALSSPPNKSVTDACQISPLTLLHLFLPLIPMATTYLSSQHLSPQTLPSLLSHLLAYKIPFVPDPQKNQSDGHIAPLCSSHPFSGQGPWKSDLKVVVSPSHSLPHCVSHTHCPLRELCSFPPPHLCTCYSL